MPGPVGPWGDALVTVVEGGRVPVETIDDKVLRLLRLAARVGALHPVGEDGPSQAQPPTPPPSAEAGDVLVVLTPDVSGPEAGDVCEVELPRIGVLMNDVS